MHECEHERKYSTSKVRLCTATFCVLSILLDNAQLRIKRTAINYACEQYLICSNDIKYCTSSQLFLFFFFFIFIIFN